VKILKIFNEMYELFFKGTQHVRTKNIFNPTIKYSFCRNCGDSDNSNHSSVNPSML